MLRASCIVLLASGCVEHVDTREELLSPAPTSALTPLQRLSGCLTFEDFQEAGVGSAWRAIDAAAATSPPHAECSNCHAFGGFSFDDTVMFRSITRSRVILKQHLRVTGTRVEPEMFAAERSLRSVASRTGQYAEHPGFEVRDVLVALDTWGALAMERQRDGTCGPPTAE